MSSGIGRVHALSLASCVHAGADSVCCVTCGVWRCRGVVLDVRAGELSGGGAPLQLQEMWLYLLEAVEGSEEAPLDAQHVLFCEVGVV